jgi:hypothetical protein
MERDENIIHYTAILMEKEYRENWNKGKDAAGGGNDDDDNDDDDNYNDNKNKEGPESSDSNNTVRFF